MADTPPAPEACPVCSPDPRRALGPGRANYEGLRITGSLHLPDPSSTEYTWYECETCGQEWTRIVDRVYRGLASFMKRGYWTEEGQQR